MDADVKSAYSGEIFDLWDTYEKVVVKDFMFHAALGEEVKQGNGGPTAVVVLVGDRGQGNARRPQQGPHVSGVQGSVAPRWGRD